MKLFNLPVTAVLRIYQLCLSPFLPASCRFYPTCSAYAMRCFKKFLFVKASWLTLRRLLRCHPFCEGGEDLVPEENYLPSGC